MATLQVESREGATSAKVGRLRASGVLPMALIIKGQGTKLVQAQEKHVRTALKGSTGAAVYSLSLDSDPKEIKVVIKEVQRDPVSRDVIHLTLQEVRDDEMIRLPVPIAFHGEPDCVTKKRSTFMSPLMHLEIYAKPADIPDHVHVDISQMEDNDKVVVGDLKLPNGVTTHVAADTVVATTFHIRTVSLEVPTAETAAAPVVLEEGAEPLPEGEKPAEEPKAEAKPAAKPGAKP